MPSLPNQSCRYFKFKCNIIVYRPFRFRGASAPVRSALLGLLQHTVEWVFGVFRTAKRRQQTHDETVHSISETLVIAVEDRFYFHSFTGHPGQLDVCCGVMLNAQHKAKGARAKRGYSKQRNQRTASSSARGHAFELSLRNLIDARERRTASA